MSDFAARIQEAEINNDEAVMSVTGEDLIAKYASGQLVVACIGAGYVGALTAITMACKNPNVKLFVCDINQRLIDRWNQDDLPFYEPQLDTYF